MGLREGGGVDGGGAGVGGEAGSGSFCQFKALNLIKTSLLSHEGGRALSRNSITQM